MERKSVSKSVGKSAITTIAAVIMTAILVGSIVGGAGYVYSKQSDGITSELKTGNSQLSSQIKATQDETIKLNSQVASIQDEGKNLRSFNEQLGSQVRTVTDDNDVLKSQLTVARDEVTRLKSNNDKLNSQINVIDADNAKLKSQVSSLSTDIKSLADAAGIPLGNSEDLRKLIEERKTIESAKQEGKVTIYYNLDARALSALMTAFERRYPSVTVEAVLGSTPAIDRFIAEFDKGTKSADVLMQNQAALGNVIKKGDIMLAKYVPKDTSWMTADQKDKDGRWAAYSVAMTVVGYNTKLIPKDQAPKTLQEIVDPKWDGKGGRLDPKVAAAVIDFIKAWEKEYGEGFVKQFAAQKARLYTNNNDLADKLASGEISIGVAPPAFFESRKQAGQPVDWVRAADTTYFGNYGLAAIASNAPHPNAAKLWMDFLLSKEGQQILADFGVIQPMPGIRLANPDLSVQGKKIVVVETLSDADRQAFLAKYPGLAPN